MAKGGKSMRRRGEILMFVFSLVLHPCSLTSKFIFSRFYVFIYFSCANSYSMYV